MNFKQSHDSHMFRINEFHVCVLVSIFVHVWMHVVTRPSPPAYVITMWISVCFTSQGSARSCFQLIKTNYLQS